MVEMCAEAIWSQHTGRAGFAADTYDHGEEDRQWWRAVARAAIEAIMTPTRRRGEVSNRTILEINHDMWSMIDKDPAGFGRAVLSFLGNASPNNAARLEDYGLKVIETAHHSTVREVIVEGRVYPL